MASLQAPPLCISDNYRQTITLIYAGDARCYTRSDSKCGKNRGRCASNWQVRRLSVMQPRHAADAQQSGRERHPVDGHRKFKLNTLLRWRGLPLTKKAALRAAFLLLWPFLLTGYHGHGAAFGDPVYQRIGNGAAITITNQLAVNHGDYDAQLVVGIRNVACDSHHITQATRLDACPRCCRAVQQALAHGAVEGGDRQAGLKLRRPYALLHGLQDACYQARRNAFRARQARAVFNLQALVIDIVSNHPLMDDLPRARWRIFRGGHGDGAAAQPAIALQRS